MYTSVGDTIVGMMLFYILLTPSGTAWSVDSWRKKTAAIDRQFPAQAWMSYLIEFQLSFLYVASALAKIQGSTWLSGGALEMILRNPRLRAWDYSFIVDSEVGQNFLRVSTLGIISWELLFPLLMFHPRTRLFAIFSGILFHLSILALIKIHLFGVIMIAIYIILLPEDWFPRFEAALKKAPQKVPFRGTSR